MDVAQQAINNDPSFIPSLGISFGLMFLCFYLLPFWIAVGRGYHRGKVFFMNFFLGWTFIGWVIALVWACQSKVNPLAEVNNALLIQVLRDAKR